MYSLLGQDWEHVHAEIQTVFEVCWLSFKNLQGICPRMVVGTLIQDCFPVDLYF